MSKYLHARRIVLQQPKKSIDYYLEGDTAEGLQFKEEIAKMSKQ
jgi:hypothetical protein